VTCVVRRNEPPIKRPSGGVFLKQRLRKSRLKPPAVLDLAQQCYPMGDDILAQTHLWRSARSRLCSCLGTMARPAASLLKSDEARRIVPNVAKLPDC
jgi:hypothetical protein